MTFDPARIPAELKARDAWIVWRSEGNGQKKTKVPYIAALKSGELTYRASSRNPKHWGSFDRALRVLERSDASGIGYVFSEDDPYAVADFDDAIGADGAVDPKVRAWLEELDTYTEISVSGRGFHVVCEANVGAGASVAGYEVYDRARYIAMTGDVWQDRGTVQERQEPFRRLSEVVRERQRRLEGRKTLERRKSAHRPGFAEGEGMDLEDFLYENRVSILREVGDAGGRKFQILCPWLTSHTEGDESGTYVGQFDDGALWFDCKHAHCVQQRWQEFREATQTENGLAEWARKLGGPGEIKITVGGSSAGGGALPEPEAPPASPQQPEEAPAAASYFEFVDLGEWMRNPPPPPDMLVRDILYPGRVSCIFSDGGMGKTFFAIWLAKRVMEKGHVVLFLDQENGVELIGRRLLDFGADDRMISERLRYAPFPMSPINAEAVEEFTGILDQHAPGLVIFDSWVNFLANAGLDENSPTDITAWGEAYSQQCRRRDIACVMLDHPGHDGDRPRGSSRKMQYVDTMFQFLRPQHFDRDTVGRIELRLKKDREGWLPQGLAFRFGGDGEKLVCERAAFDSAISVGNSLLPSDRTVLDALGSFGATGARDKEWRDEAKKRGVARSTYYKSKAVLMDENMVEKHIDSYLLNTISSQNRLTKSTGVQQGPMDHIDQPLSGGGPSSPPPTGVVDFDGPPPSKNGGAEEMKEEIDQPDREEF